MTLAKRCVVVVEEDAAIQSILRLLFEKQGFRVVRAHTYARGRLDARSYRPDVVVVDMGLMEQRGIDFIRTLRLWSSIPVVALSAPTSEAQRLAVFHAGADDYVEKPFSSLELVARTRAVFRRHARGAVPQALLNLGDVCVDLERRIAQHRDGRKLHLTPLEHRMLESFARHRWPYDDGALFTRRRRHC
jgi:two-component system KDP operon response regulator KdpE